MTCRPAHLDRLRRSLCRTSTFQIAMDENRAGLEPAVILISTSATTRPKRSGRD